MSHRKSIAFLAAGLLLTGPLSAQLKTTPLSVEDVFQLATVSEPQISPDGKRVVFVKRVADPMTDRYYANLWIAAADGDARPLTSGNHEASSPRWSPDGTRIAYVSDQDGTPQVFVRWMDTGQSARVSNLPFAPSGLAWSPDGKQLAFVTFVPEKAPEIKLPSPPAGAKWAEPATVVERLVYRFNGPGFLKPGYHHLFVMPSSGGMPRQVSTGPYQHGGAAFSASAPVFTPDGKHLLISANRHDDAELEPYDTDIYDFDLESGVVKALTSRKGPDADPSVSPDGKRVAYIGFDDTRQGYTVTRLQVMERDGSGARVVTAALDRDVRAPIWSADSRGLFFLYDEEGETKLAYTTPEGPPKVLASNVSGHLTAASIGTAATVSVARTGAYAFTTSTADRPVEVALGFGGQPPRVIATANDGLLAQRRLSKAESLWWPSSKDGRKVHGFLLKPPDFDPAKKYPLILEIHGGPFANYGDRFDMEKQLWAARGYLVLYTNPRGSTSYGQEFGNLIHHAYPGDDFYDLDSGVDAVIARGYVDRDNLFVTGGSGGGVLTCWMIGRTNRFRAAATAYPVINWTSFALTSDIPILTTKYWFPGPPWEHPEAYDKRSLLSVLKNVTTPTLVITGEEDFRTPISESEQYYQALKLKGVETRLVRVPGEPHGIRRRPSHWMAKILAIGNWFEDHRKK